MSAGDYLQEEMVWVLSVHRLYRFAHSTGQTDALLMPLEIALKLNTFLRANFQDRFSMGV
jgi:hypothetical protein